MCRLFFLISFNEEFCAESKGVVYFGGEGGGGGGIAVRKLAL